MANAVPWMLLLSLGACIVGDGTEDEDDEVDALAFGANTAAVRIVQHNIEKKDEVLRQTIRHAMDIKAHAIALQEVCPSQVEWLRANLGGRWTIVVDPGDKAARVGCDLPGGLHDKPTNVAIWTGGTGGKGTVYQELSSITGSPGGMACVKFERAKVPVHLCSAHLISGDWTDPATGITHDGAAIRLQQTTRIKQIARDNWFAGSKNHFGILAGDFNGQPNSPALDKIYDNALGGTGEFTEYNRSGGSRDGRNTAHADGSNTESGEPYSRKIDYVFFSTNRAAVDGPAVDIIRDASDHDMIVSTAHMRK